jgi:AcrR family transcriptional regulator
MSDLATALDMKRPTLYWYFRNLGEIFEAVVEQTHNGLRAFVAARLVDIDHPIDFLEQMTRAVMDFYATRRDVIVVLFQLWAVGGSDDPQRTLERGRALVEPIRTLFVGRLQAGIDAGRVAECDADAIVDLTLSVTDGALIQWVTRDADPTPIVDAFSRHVLEPLRR